MNLPRMGGLIVDAWNITSRSCALFPWGGGELNMKKPTALYLSLAVALSLAACATPRTADNVTLARVAKDYIGVGSIAEV